MFRYILKGAIFHTGRRGHCLKTVAGQLKYIQWHNTANQGYWLNDHREILNGKN